mgnify:CR=1 FL=1
MFGRRRRPILGAAVLVGASRAAARSEVQKQTQRDAETQIAVETAADRKWREERENERRTQLAIDEAIAKEKSRTENQGANMRYCSNCGNACERKDKFCSKCGQRQPTD